MDTHELAWAAGLWEGEGSVMTRTDGRNRHALQAAMVSTDLDRLEAFLEAVGIGRIRDDSPPRKPHHKQKWVYRATCHEDIQQLACLLWKWLGPRRREQFRVALFGWKTKKSRVMMKPMYRPPEERRRLRLE
ncbi:MAG: hypothetical protein ACT4PO_12210, partial [Actinomycetota bacterium]